ncbi:transporter, major facilitator family [Treponema primitia ZAS-2]|uniref:Transporter, major facilitator family n=1 Tax=Treponema primitia (strain ATCC BAA-887 / DSM 12427 / ZAS-2) TaxID=545694 RepID=F5YPE3_TREPZ|nr:MFS transporter [Treponema primitia]AEF85834.1 transporter, major facilitator family [Treponema primitia ZAS-2]
MQEKGKLTKVSLLFSGCTYNINVVSFAVALGAIAGNFHATPTQLSQLTNLPALFMIPAVLISAKLAERISKKDILLVAWILFMLGGLITTLAPSIMVLYVARALTGFAIGLISSIPRAMIAQLYPTEIGKLTGFQTSCTAAVSVTCSLLAGFLATISWRHPIYLFYLGIIVFLLILFFIPRVPAEKKEFAEEKKERKPYGARILFTVLSGTLAFMLFVPIQTKLTLIIMQGGFGGSVEAGYARAILTVGSVTGGLVFAALAKKNKKAVLILALGLAAIGYYFVSTTNSLYVLFVSIFFAGLGSLGMTLPWFGSTIAQSVDRSRVTMLLSIFTICNYLSQFLTTYLVAGMEMIAGNSKPTTAIFGTFILIVIFLVGATIVLFIVPKKPAPAATA